MWGGVAVFIIYKPIADKDEGTTTLTSKYFVYKWNIIRSFFQFEM